MSRALGAMMLAMTAGVFAVEPTDDELSKKPIATDKSELGKLLTQWHKDGTAAGNVGDWYDNRDGEHSPLNLSPWPQLQKVKYSEEDVKRRRHWAFMPRTRKHVTFGNSSTSGPAHLNGSNPRTGYSVHQGLQILESQYLENNLYIYPEHRDHDVGHNGVGEGYGDLFPTNTPYLLISQGSSGSDQPFMRAMPFTLAAFRPDTKKKLIESGLLMPTVQMIFRASNSNVKDEKEYLTGKAHPTVFEGGHVDALKMVKLAHEITADKIPPLVKLAVKDEEKVETGKDFFEPPGLAEPHSDTACVIARVWRGAAHKRRMLVSAEGSIDGNKKALTFTWVVLRGDEKRISIAPKNKAGSIAEITVEYHERRPISAKSNLESNRVDIGVFAHNGSYYSAPAFVTFFSLDSEARTYDDKGRILEIGYGMGEIEMRVADHAKACETLGKEGLAATVLKLTKEHREELATAAKLLVALQVEVDGARKARQKGEQERNQAIATVRKAEQLLEKLKKDNAGEEKVKEAELVLRKAKADQAASEIVVKALNERVVTVEKALNLELDKSRPALSASVRTFLARSLDRAAKSPTLWNEHHKALWPEDSSVRNAAVEAARSKLVRLGIVAKGQAKTLTFTPVRPGKGEPAERLSVYEGALLVQFNAVVLERLVLPGLVSHTFRTNFVDARLSAPKNWRDVYRYEGDRVAGWIRYTPGSDEPETFTAEGWLVTSKDDRGRPMKARTVVYKQDAPKQPVWANTNPLKHVRGEESIAFEYEGEQRKIKSREKVLERKGE